VRSAIFITPTWSTRRAAPEWRTSSTRAWSSRRRPRSFRLHRGICTQSS
jgi:hypothetical protein